MKLVWKNIKYKGIYNQLFGVGNTVSPEKIETGNAIADNILENMVMIQSKMKNSGDFNVRELTVGGIQVNVFTNEGMTDIQTINRSMVEMVNHFEQGATSEQIYTFIESGMLFASELKDVYTFEDLFKLMMSGFMIILIDGINCAIALGAQGFAYRSISEPSSEINVKGSREGFTEPIKVNMSLIRRRIRSNALRFELLQIGKDSQTDVCLAFMEDIVSQKLLRQIRYRLSKIDSKIVLDSGYVQPFLESVHGSLFSDVGYTERPDTVCAKIYEGRVAILVDGTPFVLIVPYLFSENFQSIDDYNHKAYYGSFVRILKYVAFLITIFLPGTYVAVGTYHPELFPPSLLFNIVSSQETTPFPMMVEALFIHFVYEIMQEAGLRLPRPIGFAISIVGSLVIGDAAVTAGLIGSPMVMVVALTAIASFVVPSLQEPSEILKFAFIIIGGTTGLYGIALGGVVVLVNACSLNAFGAPFLSPIAPFSGYSMRDTFIRAGFKTLQAKDVTVDELNGVHLDKQ